MTDGTSLLCPLDNSFKATGAFLDVRKEDDNFRGGEKKKRKKSMLQGIS